MSTNKRMVQEVQRRIDYIDRRLQTEIAPGVRDAWRSERQALAWLLTRNERHQGVIVALELIADAARNGDVSAVLRIAYDTLERRDATGAKMTEPREKP